MDENSKVDAGAVTKPSTSPPVNDSATSNPSSDPPVMDNGGGAGDVVGSGPESNGVVMPSRSSRTPFTTLNQVDADLALARTLQEQERAYMMLHMNGEGVNYGIHYNEDEYDEDDLDDDEYDEFEEDDDDGDFAHDDNGEDVDGDNDEEDAFDVHAHADSIEGGTEIDPEAFPNDEAYARALQDAEEQEMAARLWAMAGITEREVMDSEDRGDNSQDAWEEVDPDELSYEELLALGEVVGTESRGLSADTIAALPSLNYCSEKTLDGETDLCVICRLEYEEGESLIVLSCKHSYHADCINNWLKLNKVCPVCSAEVSSSATSL